MNKSYTEGTIKYYTYDYCNGTRWAIRFGGFEFQLTSKVERLIRKAPNEWKTLEEAKQWVAENLK